MSCLACEEQVECVVFAQFVLFLVHVVLFRCRFRRLRCRFRCRGHTPRFAPGRTSQRQQCRRWQCRQSCGQSRGWQKFPWGCRGRMCCLPPCVRGRKHPPGAPCRGMVTRPTRARAAEGGAPPKPGCQPVCVRSATVVHTRQPTTQRGWRAVSPFYKRRVRLVCAKNGRAARRRHVRRVRDARASVDAWLSACAPARARARASTDARVSGRVVRWRSVACLNAWSAGRPGWQFNKHVPART